MPSSASPTNGWGSASSRSWSAGRRSTDVDEASLLEHCRANLARYKVPETITFVSGFDRTPMGKIRKTVLRDGAARVV